MTCELLFRRIPCTVLLGVVLLWTGVARAFESPDGDPAGETQPLAPEARATNEAADRALGAHVPNQPVADEEVPPSDSPIIGDGITQTQEPLSPEMTALRSKVRQALGMYFHRPLNTVEHNPWEVMHGIIAYGVDAQLRRGGVGGQEVNGIAYLSINGPCRGMELMQLDERGRLSVRIGPYVQGHAGQLLAILAQCHVPAEYPIRVAGRSFTLQDLIETEQQTCEPDSELTFKLIGLSHYLESDATWQDQRGRTWSIARLVREEIRQPILYTAACGGTHRLMGLSYSIYKRRQQGKRIDGEFARAQKYLYDYHRYAFALQNRDGSFSTEWFKGPGNRPDLDRKIKTTGHILEWLAFSLPEKHLSDPRMVRAVNFIASSLVGAPDHTWEIGPHGHAIHALRIYYRRRFRPYDEQSRPARAPLAGGSTTPVDAAHAAAAATDPAEPGTAAASGTDATSAEGGASAEATQPAAATSTSEHRVPAEGSTEPREGSPAEAALGPMLEVPGAEAPEVALRAEETSAAPSTESANEAAAVDFAGNSRETPEADESAAEPRDETAAEEAGPALGDLAPAEPSDATSDEPVASDGVDPAGPTLPPSPEATVGTQVTENGIPAPAVASAPPMTAAAPGELTPPAADGETAGETEATAAAVAPSTESIPAIESPVTAPVGPQGVAAIPALRRDKRQPAPPTKPSLSPVRVPKGVATAPSPAAEGSGKNTARRPHAVRRQAAKPRGQSPAPEGAYK